jgi:hypothetical protein
LQLVGEGEGEGANDAEKQMLATLSFSRLEEEVFLESNLIYS